MTVQDQMKIFENKIVTEYYCLLRKTIRFIYVYTNKFTSRESEYIFMLSDSFVKLAVATDRILESCNLLA